MVAAGAVKLAALNRFRWSLSFAPLLVNLAMSASDGSFLYWTITSTEAPGWPRSFVRSLEILCRSAYSVPASKPPQRITHSDIFLIGYLSPISKFVSQGVMHARHHAAVEVRD